MASQAEPQLWRKSLLRECFEALVVAVMVALFLRTFVVQAFQIPSVSMEPSLLVGDRLFVDKLVYTPSLGRFEDALMAKRPVRRSDVVVFRSLQDAGRTVVKRVVALAGETVEIRDRRVLVDGRALQEPYAQFVEAELPPEHPDYGLREERALLEWGPQRVPGGHVFVLGDNRDRSKDSRSWGFLPLSQVEGRALLVFWSSAPGAEPAGAGGWRAALGRPRWERLFHAVR